MTTFVQAKLDADQIVVDKLDLSTGPHDFSFQPNGQFLSVQNDEATPVTVTLSDANVSIVDIDGLGQTDLSAGKDFTVEVGEVLLINLDAHRYYFGRNGSTVDVTITGATGESFAWLTR